jgi:hypothetical protein
MKEGHMARARSFESLIGDTDAYASGEELSGPFGRIKRIARRGIKAVAANPIALSAYAAKYAAKGVAAVTGPVRRRIFRAFFGKLVNRRASLLAWQHRQSLRPTAADKQEAQRWATAYVKRKGILGRLVGATLSGEMGAEPVTASILTISIPALIEIARRSLKAAEREGAPADPRTTEQPADEG